MPWKVYLNLFATVMDFPDKVVVSAFTPNDGMILLQINGAGNTLLYFDLTPGTSNLHWTHLFPIASNMHY